MRVTTSSFSDNFLNEISQLENRQNTLQTETTTGLSVQQPGDNPGVMDQMLNLQSEATATTAYQSNIAQLNTSATTASDALNSIQTLVEDAGEIATNANGVTSPTQLATYSAQVGNLITEAVGLGNTQDSQGNYIFGGTASGSPPFTATTDASGNVTGVAYTGNTSANSVAIAPGLTVTAQTPGENTTGTGATGVFADSRNGSDLFSNLISLQQDLISGNTSDITTNVSPALAKDEDNVVSQVSANGVLQSTLQAAGASATQTTSNITGQMSNDTNANLAQTLTLLDQTQTSYQAALQSGTMIMNLSLMEYLQ
jgi:flagellar hook-associated protein 3 FlgL